MSKFPRPEQVALSLAWEEIVRRFRAMSTPQLCDEINRLSSRANANKRRESPRCEAPNGWPEGPIGQREAPNGWPEGPIGQREAPNGWPFGPIGQREAPNGWPEGPIGQPLRDAAHRADGLRKDRNGTPSVFDRKNSTFHCAVEKRPHRNSIDQSPKARTSEASKEFRAVVLCNFRGEGVGRAKLGDWLRCFPLQAFDLCFLSADDDADDADAPEQAILIFHAVPDMRRAHLAAAEALAFLRRYAPRTEPLPYTAPINTIAELDSELEDYMRGSDP